MAEISDEAILLKKTEHKDQNYILLLFTKNNGKVSVIAKNAKKSIIRFQGTLDLFNEINVIYEDKKPLSFLKEASLQTPFMNIRKNVKKIAYVSYFAEILIHWFEMCKSERKIYDLLRYILLAIDEDKISTDVLSVFFQIRFLNLIGITPNFTHCLKCNKNLFKDTKSNTFMFNIGKGGMVCSDCYKENNNKNTTSLSKGAIKQLSLINSVSIEKAERIKFTKDTLSESLSFLENFLLFYLDVKPKSLEFIYKVCR